jgi:hypothetical protein
MDRKVRRVRTVPKVLKVPKEATATAQLCLPNGRKKAQKVVRAKPVSQASRKAGMVLVMDLKNPLSRRPRDCRRKNWKN